jgi:hypothetical protein
MSDLPKSQEVLENLEHDAPQKDWMDVPADIRKGMYCYAANPKSLEALGFPYARSWNPMDEDWKLPETGRNSSTRDSRSGWKSSVLQGFHGHLRALRGLRRQMPFLHRHRRSQEHAGACGPSCSDPSTATISPRPGKSWARLAGAAGNDRGRAQGMVVLLSQCTECRRCSLFCPYGIDTAEITIMGRELLNLLG